MLGSLCPSPPRRQRITVLRAFPRAREVVRGRETSDVPLSASANWLWQLLSAMLTHNDINLERHRTTGRRKRRDPEGITVFQSVLDTSDAAIWVVGVALVLCLGWRLLGKRILMRLSWLDKGWITTFFWSTTKRCLCFVIKMIWN